MSDVLTVGIDDSPPPPSRVEPDPRRAGGRLDRCRLHGRDLDEERAREFDYGRPYLDMALAVVVRADEDVDSLDGRSFAVRVATTAEQYIRLRLRPSRVTTFEYNRETYDALARGEADGVVDDSPIAAWFAREDSRLRSTWFT